MMGKNVAGVMGGYLPQAVTEMWEPMRDFAFIKLPKASLSTNSTGAPLRTVVAMSSSSPQIMVVTSDGGFYVFSIDMELGGEGVLLKQYSYVFLNHLIAFADQSLVLQKQRINLISPLWIR